MLLKDKVIFLTGGSKGIGYECAKTYIREGARISILGKEKEIIERLQVELGTEHLCLSCDISSERDVKDAMNKTVAFFGRLDGIHNNAGIATPSKTLDETSDNEWNDLFNTNLKGIYLTTKYGLEHIRKTEGVILNTSSLVGSIGQEMHAAYSATKGGINALTKSMALDYAKYRIRVNAVCPAAVWTPMLRQWSSEQFDSVGEAEFLNNIHALGYCPEADVVADVCVFLLSEKSRFITGCIMPVSGGAELGYRILTRKK